MSNVSRSVPAQTMHKFVWSCLGILGLFVITTPLAMQRVSQTEKFKGSHVKSLTDDWKMPKQLLQAESKTPLSLEQNVGYRAHPK